MRALASLVVALLVLSVPASASWVAMGQVEPSTPYDVAHGSMPFAPDVVPEGMRVYFQAFQSVDESTFNPNVGTVGSRVLPPGAVHHRALLGVWKDCNRDGYVGLAESAIQDYASIVLLGDDRVCPSGGLFNDGQWVSEMLMVGMVDPCEYASDAVRKSECADMPVFHANERVIYVNGTMVWADVGAPGGVPPAECPLTPPRGTTSGTGLLLAFADCQVDRRASEALAGVDPEGAHDITFPLTPFGGPEGPGVLEAGTGQPAATVWDCSQQRSFVVVDPLGLPREVVVEDPSGGRLSGEQPALPILGKRTIFEDHDSDASTPGILRTPIMDDEGVILHAPAIDPQAPGGSAWDATEHAADGPNGDCDGRTQLRDSAPGPFVESGAPYAEAALKDRASFSFTFYDGHRGLNEGCVSDAPGDDVCFDSLLGPTTPSDGGLMYMRHGRSGSGPLWSADAPAINEPHLVTRGTLAPSAPAHWTYYARLGPDGVDMGLASTEHKYASEACGLHTSGVHGGWVCDKMLWWRDALGGVARPRYMQGEPYGPLPGDGYHFRDVDCYDGNVALGMYVGGAAISGEVCESAP